MNAIAKDKNLEYDCDELEALVKKDKYTYQRHHYFFRKKSRRDSSSPSATGAVSRKDSVGTVFADAVSDLKLNEANQSA
jgi:hypothetical protein